ncbi:MAG: T9SS type A sorting domain-containing protein [Saprospiraceae bacterium]|nr:T9SS type A sorting domain-containing protein [Saprospiraceae bacterium]
MFRKLTVLFVAAQLINNAATFKPYTTMRKFVLLSVFLFNVSASSTWAQLLFSESFSYTAGDLTANSSGNWTAHSGATGIKIQTSPTTPLTFTGYAGSGGGSVALANSSTNSEDANRAFTTQSSGAVYASFMVRYTSAPTTGDYNVHFRTSTGITMARLYARDDGSGNLKLGVSKAGISIFTYATGNYAYNTTYLVVLKYQFVAGTFNDVFSLFIFSPGNSIPNSEPASPQATDAPATDGDAANLGAFALRQSSITPMNSIIGGIRVATTWGQAALPVELLSFSGKNTEGGNLLTWETASEVNNKGFEVEKSSDGLRFEKVGFVAGNNKASTYQFLDNLTSARVETSPTFLTYYRLRQIDNDGKEILSKVISIQNKGAKGSLAVYPNPVSTHLTIEGIARDEATEGPDFQIFNLLGQQVLTGKTPSGGRGLDVSALPQGSYVLKVGAEQVKFVKQ